MARRRQVLALKNVIEKQDMKLEKKRKEFDALVVVAENLLAENHQLKERLKETEVSHG